MQDRVPQTGSTSVEHPAVGLQGAATTSRSPRRADTATSSKTAGVRRAEARATVRHGFARAARDQRCSTIEASIRGHQPAKVERAIDEELARFGRGAHAGRAPAGQDPGVRGPGSSAASRRVGGFGGSSKTCWPRARSSPAGRTSPSLRCGEMAGATAAQIAGSGAVGRRRVHAHGRKACPTTPWAKDAGGFPAKPEAEFPLERAESCANGPKVVLAEQRANARRAVGPAA